MENLVAFERQNTNVLTTKIAKVCIMKSNHMATMIARVVHFLFVTSKKPTIPTHGAVFTTKLVISSQLKVFNSIHHHKISKIRDLNMFYIC